MDVNDLSIHTNAKPLLSMKNTKEMPDREHYSNDFGENACGEPLAPQHLVVDFTPNDEDTEFIQKKCCAFWDFITSCPELENFVILQDPNLSEKKSRPSDIELAPIKTFEQQQEHVRTAVSMIEFVEEKGLITRAFEAKLPQPGCSIGSQDYFDEKSKTSRATKKGEVCTCATICPPCVAKTVVAQEPKASSDGVQEMCKELQYWDAEHPKSMDPPGHSPSLISL